MRKLAEHILDSKAAELTPHLPDRYEEALLAHLKAKQAGAVQERRQTFARRIGWSISWRRYAVAWPRHQRSRAA